MLIYLQASVNSAEDEVDWYLTTVLDQYVQSTNPHVRQASSIWLLALVKKCGYHQALQSRLPKLQSAFMQLLSENDGITFISGFIHFFPKHVFL